MPAQQDEESSRMNIAIERKLKHIVHRAFVFMMLVITNPSARRVLFARARVALKRHARKMWAVAVAAVAALGLLLGTAAPATAAPLTTVKNSSTSVVSIKIANQLSDGSVTYKTVPPGATVTTGDLDWIVVVKVNWWDSLSSYGVTWYDDGVKRYEYDGYVATDGVVSAGSYVVTHVYRR